MGRTGLWADTSRAGPTHPVLEGLHQLLVLGLPQHVLALHHLGVAGDDDTVS